MMGSNVDKELTTGEQTELLGSWKFILGDSHEYMIPEPI